MTAAGSQRLRVLVEVFATEGLRETDPQLSLKCGRHHRGFYWWFCSKDIFHAYRVVCVGVLDQFESSLAISVPGFEHASRFDTSGDGVLSEEEMGQLFRALHFKKGFELMKQADANKDQGRKTGKQSQPRPRAYLMRALDSPFNSCIESELIPRLK